MVETHQVELRQAARFGKEEGIEIGEQKGKKETQEEIAINLLKAGVAPSVIATATSLTAEQIKSLK